MQSKEKDRIEFTNPLLDSIRESYPEELSLGEYCVEQMRERLDIVMSKDEAGFIAMHIINARLDTKMSDDATFVAMIKKTCNKHINDDELITLAIHLKKISIKTDF